MAGICHRCHHLLPHRGAHSQSVGLPRVHRQCLQTGNRASAGRPFLHARRQPVYPSGRPALRCGTDHQHHVGTPQRRLHPVPLLDHHPLRTPAHHQRRDLHPATGAPHRRERHGGRSGIYLQRHLLVLGCRERGLRLLQFPHRPCVLAHPEMGRRGRRPAERPVDCPHRLHRRTVDRCPSAQPAVHPLHGTHHLLQESQDGKSMGRTHGLRLRHTGGAGHPIRHRAGHHQDRRMG